MTEPVRRHHWIVRLTHWCAFALIFGMIASGLQIYRAYPRFGERGGPYYPNAFQDVGIIGAALMLMTKNYPALGALLGIGVMCGAVIAHVSVLGFNVQGDRGLHILLLLTVVLSSGTVLIARRKTLPFIGPTLD